MYRILIRWPRGQTSATLDDTPSARALMAALPLESSASTWGDEVYFDVGIQPKLEPDARQVVDPGTVCLWVEGSSLALPFGPTPVSEAQECRLVTAVNVLGRLDDDARILASIIANDGVSVTAITS